MKQESSPSRSTKSRTSPAKRAPDRFKLTRSLMRKRDREAVLSHDDRVNLFAEWVASEPWTGGRSASREVSDDFDLVQLVAWLLADDVARTLTAVGKTHRQAVENFVIWVLGATKANTAFFTTRHSGYVVNTYGPPYHRPAARLAQAVAVSAENLGVKVPEELRVPEMPFLEVRVVTTLLPWSPGDKPGIWILRSYLSDWETGSDWGGPAVPQSSTFTEPTAALTAFHSHQAALDAQANDVGKEVRGNDDDTKSGGLDVINVLFFVPFTEITNTDPVGWRLADDKSDYVIQDGSYAFSFDGETRHAPTHDYIDDTDLREFLPPAVSVKQGRRRRRQEGQ